MLCVTLSFAQKATNYNEVKSINTINNNTFTAIVINKSNSRQPVIDTYDNFDDFSNAVVASCQDSNLTFEDFLGGPNAIQECGLVINNTGSTCYPAGEIESGITIAASSSANTVFVPAAALGNSDPLVGASPFEAFTIITFTEAVYAVAFDIWENEDPVTTVRIFGTSDDLITTLEVDKPILTQTFFGFIADEEIGKIELEGNNDSGELLGNLYFGASDCMELSIADLLQAKIQIYPNPATDSIQIYTPENIEVLSILISDIRGNRIISSYSNSQIDVSNLSKGVYLINIETNEGSLIKKLVKS